MSNRFNLSQFSTSLFTMTCAREERPQALAKFIAESLRDSALDWLLEGSDCLTQVLSKFEGAGKSAIAVKFRKIIRNAGASLAPYGEISGLSLVKNSFPGGNGAQGAKDHDNRRAVCEALYSKVYTYACFVFAPSVPDGAVDPLASFGAFSEKSIAIKLSSANIEQLREAVKRTITLSSLIAGELESRMKAEAPAEVSAEVSAEVPAEAPAEVSVEVSAEASAEVFAEVPAKTRRVISVKRKLAA